MQEPSAMYAQPVTHSIGCNPHPALMYCLGQDALRGAGHVPTGMEPADRSGSVVALSADHRHTTFGDVRGSAPNEYEDMAPTMDYGSPTYSSANDVRGSPVQWAAVRSRASAIQELVSANVHRVCNLNRLAKQRDGTWMAYQMTCPTFTLRLTSLRGCVFGLFWACQHCPAALSMCSCCLQCLSHICVCPCTCVYL